MISCASPSFHRPACLDFGRRQVQCHEQSDLRGKTFFLFTIFLSRRLRLSMALVV